MEAINLFEQYDLLPAEPKKLLEQMEEETQGELTNDLLNEWHDKFTAIGYTFDWYLDCNPYALTSIKFFDELKNIYESGDLAIPKGEAEGNTAYDYTWSSLIQGYYTFKSGQRVDITLDNLLGK